MSLQSLPDELITRVFYHVLDDPESYKNLLWTCKRFCNIGNLLIMTTPEGRESRLFAFNLDLSLESYLPQLCRDHGFCSEQKWRSKTKCEMQHGRLEEDELAIRHNPNEVQEARQTIISSVSSPLIMTIHIDNLQESCYYHRLYCMLSAKYITFSSITFKNARLLDRGCVRALRDFMKLNYSTSQIFSKSKLCALAELELYNCNISLDWLNTILNELDHIAYLGLVGVSFVDPVILVESKDMASKTLKRLRISGDRACGMNDAIFTYFLDHFPASTLDLTGTRVEFHKRIIQRFYPYGLTLDMYAVQPSELLFTFPIILLYLKKYSSIVDLLVVDQTDITLATVKRLLQDEELGHLTISVRQCRMVSEQERLRLAEQISPSSMSRVAF